MHSDIDAFLRDWTHDPGGLADSFARLRQWLSDVPGTVLELVVRPGVSASLRAGPGRGANRPLYALVDVIEDVGGRFLSVCFYADAVTDPDGLGNLVPLGLLGEDGYCFDLDGPDEALMDCLRRRVAEAARPAAP